MQAVRASDFVAVKEVLSKPDAPKLARAKNYYGKICNHDVIIFQLDQV